MRGQGVRERGEGQGVRGGQGSGQGYMMHRQAVCDILRLLTNELDLSNHSNICHK